MPIQRDKDVFVPLPQNWWTRDVAKPTPTEQAPLQPLTQVTPPIIWRIGQSIRKLLRILIWPLVLAINLILTAAVATCVFYLWIIPTLPGESAIIDVGSQRPLLIYNADGQLMGEYGAERREPLRYADTPPLLIKAFLAAEDNRFFEHSGVDIYGLARAALNLARTGEASQGGSTITMQLVRNLFLTPEKNIQRKLSELALAMHLEARFSKQQIFELYQNRIFFGHHAYGVAAAASIYYGKKVDQLSLAQMATLAGIPQAPSIHNPVTHPQRSVVRRTYVLTRMLALGWITQAQFDQANTAPEDARIVPTKIDFEAPYLTEMARQEAKNRYGNKVYTSGLRLTTTVDAKLQQFAKQAVINALLSYDQRHGYRGAEAKVNLLASHESWDALLAEHPSINGLDPAIVTKVSTDGAKLYFDNKHEGILTSSNALWAMPSQRRKNSPGLTSILQPGDLIRIRTDDANKLVLTQIPLVEGALVAISPKDGAIKALVGGFDFKRSQFNRAADARRQPGSSFKPFVYTAALAQGWTPTSIINDAPIQIRNGRHIWKPKNFDGRFLGKITLRLALADSRNLAAVQLLRILGVEPVRTFATRFGFRPEQLPSGLSLALGSGESAPLQMAGAYAPFDNGGFRVNPYLIKQVQDYNEHTIFQADPNCPDCNAIFTNTATDSAGLTEPLVVQHHKPEPILEQKVVDTAKDLLQEVIRSGTGKRALVLKRSDLAGKTGTSNGVRDAWFCGFNPDLIAVTWLGFDDFSPLGKDEVGGHSALDMWVDFMGYALNNKPGIMSAKTSNLSSPKPLNSSNTQDTTEEKQNVVDDIVTEEDIPAPTNLQTKPKTPASNSADAASEQVDDSWQDDNNATAPDATNSKENQDNKQPFQP